METVRTFFNGFRRRHHPTLFNGFRRWFLYGFRRGRKLFMVSVVAGKHLFMVSMLAAASEIIFDSSQIRDCAGDPRARSDSDIVMRSPAAKDPDLTSGLGCVCSITGVRVFKVIAFACCCLLVACFCLFLFVFCFLPEP